MEPPPFFSLPLPTFFLFFTTIYFLGYFVIFRNWNATTRPQASSCFLSLSHGTPAVVLSTLSLLQKTPKTHFNFASPNTPLQNLTLDYSTAYFLVDLLHYLLFVPTDHLFIAHHAATLYVFLTCRYAVNHGAYPLLVLLVLAEVTSACQNTWTLAGFRREESPAAAAVYGFLSPVFYSVYTVVRGVLGPAFVWEMGVFYLRGGGDGAIPTWVWGSWMVVIVSAILVSDLWVWNRWVDWCTQRRKKD
ncbi:TLC domain-containing protein At5g14285-like [Rhododendron vialii]|uniref:TLC domain-containing protein At5g14285-like n=1 Tax=Rhododendron vialii TaxID=182163 RepID=UPI00265EC9C8|nr:TLC domain-containing protein At5g14285-like [Rhododendron vialii]XP_058192701.1 TLC domain-containing protein At5g14285-like [Rhododendron vialii]XP_058192702.1 TLC domain-containing protein At5g14285-like [Rhododendron vialii]